MEVDTEAQKNARRKTRSLHEERRRLEEQLAELDREQASAAELSARRPVDVALDEVFRKRRERESRPKPMDG